MKPGDSRGAKLSRSKHRDRILDQDRGLSEWTPERQRKTESLDDAILAFAAAQRAKRSST